MWHLLQLVYGSIFSSIVFEVIFTPNLSILHMKRKFAFHYYLHIVLYLEYTHILESLACCIYVSVILYLIFKILKKCLFFLMFIGYLFIFYMMNNKFHYCQHIT